MGKNHIYRRTLGLAVAASLVALTACGGTGEAEDNSAPDGEVTLRWAFWGSSTRAEISEEIIAAFEAEHPGITVEYQYSGSMADHMNLVSTQTAGGDAPDIIQTEERYFREYADRGSLLELDQVDIADFSEASLAGGSIDGTLYGISSGDNTFTLLANTDLFDEAGVDLPDDSTWTWDDYADIAQEISDNLDSVYGAASPTIMGAVNVWLRQQGQNIATSDGQLGFDAEGLAGLFEMDLELMRSGALQPAELAETQEAELERSLIAQGRAAMSGRWSNQVADVSGLTGAEIVPLRYPSPTGNVEDNGMFLKASQLMTVSSTTDYPEEAQQFIDFVVNSQEAGQIGLVDRGFPANSAVRDSITGELDEDNQRAADFMTEITPELGDPSPVPPAGFGAATDVLLRYYQEVLFERQTPEEAAENAVRELESLIS